MYEENVIQKLVKCTAGTFWSGFLTSASTSTDIYFYVHFDCVVVAHRYGPYPDKVLVFVCYISLLECMMLTLSTHIQGSCGVLGDYEFSEIIAYTLDYRNLKSLKLLTNARSTYCNFLKFYTSIIVQRNALNEFHAFSGKDFKASVIFWSQFPTTITKGRPGRPLVHFHWFYCTLLNVFRFLILLQFTTCNLNFLFETQMVNAQPKSWVRRWRMNGPEWEIFLILRREVVPCFLTVEETFKEVLLYPSVCVM